MFNKLYGQLGQQNTQDEIDPEFEDMYQESFDTDKMETDPESVLNDSQSSPELKKMAMDKVLSKYLKPKEDK